MYVCMYIFINIILDQGLLLLHQMVQSNLNIYLRPLLSILRIFFKQNKSYNDQCTFLFRKTFCTILNNKQN